MTHKTAHNNNSNKVEVVVAEAEMTFHIWCDAT